ncbi:MAG: SDR family NAD(P)-dependent oxidoreductase [Bacteroidales bacterium]|nr:SDR family NAD(P)-dependent oxidoreductase [Candidatus Physcousia equi]
MKRVAVITGASSGIGRASAAELVKRGYVVYDLSRTENPQAGVKHIDCDVTKTDTIQSAFAQIREEAGRIDLLLLSAGMGVAGAIEFTTESEMQRQFDVNLYGPIRVIQAALPIMRTQAMQERNNVFGLEGKGLRSLIGCPYKERGRIVFVSSMTAAFSIPFQSMYSATKSALNSFAFALRNELKHYDIRVSSVMPGDVHTNFKRTTDLNGSDIYPHMKPAIEQMIHDEENGLTSEQVARRVMRASLRRRPAIFYTSDLLSDLERFAARIVTSNMAVRIVGMMYKS